MERRSFLLGAPLFLRAESGRPRLTQGVQTGDPAGDSVLVWTRADRPSRMWVEVALDEKFKQVIQRVRGPHLLPETDYTGRHVVSGLPAGADVHYRVWAEDLREGRGMWEAVCRRARPARGGGGELGDVMSGGMVGQCRGRVGLGG
ncbi:MAG: PhoD-like phosphatase N-terminal domain-containing protein, partial [Acidobacteriota bacterium]